MCGQIYDGHMIKGQVMKREDGIMTNGQVMRSIRSSFPTVLRIVFFIVAYVEHLLFQQ